MREVVLFEEERASLLALILRNFFRRLLEQGSEGVRQRLAALAGTVLLSADRMQVHLTFGEAIEIRTGVGEAKATTRIRGELGALVRFIAHKRFVGALLTGKLGFSGSPLLAIRLFLLFLRA
ncbi:MAG: hypothetical protein FJ109_09795 [Deltaproteobacteria bacterium]|nr:hypothetical protein [Deltaproteobacteria bacterium]